MKFGANTFIWESPFSTDAHLYLLDKVRQMGFDLLAALCLALATMSLGVMGAFALVFIPPWLAFRRAANWRAGLRWALGIGVTAYCAAFGLALGLDQPFGPVLAILLVLVGLLVA